MTLQKWALACLLILSVTSNSQAADCRYTVAWTDWFPYTYLNEHNSLVGLDIEIIEALAHKLDCQLTFINMPWKRQLISVAQGKIDFIPGAYYTEQRAEWAYISSAYRNETAAVFTTKNHPAKDRLKSLADIIPANFTLALTRAGYFGAEHEKLMKTKEYSDLIYFTGNNENRIDMLKKGRIDGFIGAKISDLKTLRERGLGEEIIALPFTVLSSGVHILFNKKTLNQQQVDAFNRQIEWFRHSQQYQKLQLKYLK